MKITFFGAAQNVTGSKHLIQTKDFNLLLDCGLYQGRRNEANLQNKNLPFDAEKIDTVILSHAHLDHCGTLPVLVKNGFAGKIYCTPATAEIAKFILMDSAGIQEQDAEYLNKHLKEGEEEIVPIYTKEDVEKVLEHFEPVEYFRFTNKWTKLNNEIRFKLYDAGHILGSAITVIEVKEGKETKTVVFSGDLGRDYSPILCSPESVAEKADLLITECTYGDRIHRPIHEAVLQLKEVVSLAVKDKKKIIVPAFSLGRTQELIYIIHKLIDEKQISDIPIYIDSPLAEKITDVFGHYIKYFDEDFWRDFGNKKSSPFTIKNLHYVGTIQESKNLNNLEGPLMIISASGMAEGGRVLHHLKNNIPDPNNIVLITGFQAENTLGRRMQEGVNPVRIYGKEYPLNAKVITLDEFSAHADSRDLLKYIEKIKGLKDIFLVHSEPNQASAFGDMLKEQVKGVNVTIPRLNESFEK